MFAIMSHFNWLFVGLLPNILKRLFCLHNYEGGYGSRTEWHQIPSSATGSAGKSTLQQNNQPFPLSGADNIYWT